MTVLQNKYKLMLHGKVNGKSEPVHICLSKILYSSKNFTLVINCVGFSIVKLTFGMCCDFDFITDPMMIS